MKNLPFTSTAIAHIITCGSQKFTPSMILTVKGTRHNCQLDLFSVAVSPQEEQHVLFVDSSNMLFQPGFCRRRQTPMVQVQRTSCVSHNISSFQFLVQSVYRRAENREAEMSREVRSLHTCLANLRGAGSRNAAFRIHGKDSRGSQKPQDLHRESLEARQWGVL